MSENAYVCPYCQSENIQSYNIAYAGGFSNVNGVTTGVGIITLDLGSKQA